MTAEAPRPALPRLIVAVAVLLHTCAPSEGTVSSTNLLDDFLDILELISLDKIFGILRDYYETDQDVKVFLDYFLSPEVKEYGEWMHDQPAMQKAVHYLEDHGVPIYKLLNFTGALHDATPVTLREDQDHDFHSVGHMTDEIKRLIPLFQLTSLFTKKIRTSPDFRGFMKILRSDKFNDFIIRARNHDTGKKIRRKLKEAGVDVKTVDDSLLLAFGWSPRRKNNHSANLLHKLLPIFY